MPVLSLLQKRFQYRDSFRFIGILSGVAFLGFLGSVTNFVKLGVSCSNSCPVQFYEPDPCAD